MGSGFAAILGLSILAWGEVPNFLAGMLPSLMTIGRFAADPSDRAKLRRGEVVGTALAMTIGLGVTLIAKSQGMKHWWLPLAGTAVVSGVLIREYEIAIRDAQTNPNTTPINEQHGATQFVAQHGVGTFIDMAVVPLFAG